MSRFRRVHGKWATIWAKWSASVTVVIFVGYVIANGHP